MRCDICKRKTEGVFLSPCPQCGALYCPACMAQAEREGHLGSGNDLADYIWRNCQECGVIRV